MQWLLRTIAGALMVAGIALVVVVAFPPGGGRSTRPLDLPAWAAASCGATAAFGETILKSRDNIEPSTLELAARKERAARLGKIEGEASTRLAKDLREITPPDAAAGYHRALIMSAEEYAATASEQLGIIAKAANAPQIAVANVSARFRLSGADQNVTAAASNLPPAALAALRAEPRCGMRPGAQPAPGV